jgi:Fe-S-cluster containining protein
LPVSQTARQIMHRIVEKLSALEQLECSSPFDRRFQLLFGEVVGLVERYQEAMVAPSGYTVSCTRGCNSCCCHLVEDVNSFEAAIITDFLRTTIPERIPGILKRCESDCRELERLEKLVVLKLREHDVTPAGPLVDPIDLLLSVFYQMRRPCPLLSEDGSCSIYEVRPLTCRIYVSFSDPLRCDPEYINSSVVPTCLIDLSEAANGVLDSLHFRYVQFDGDTGLRSLLVKYLSGNQT